MRRFLSVLLLVAASAGAAFGQMATGIAIYGDSTARGFGAQENWHERLATMLEPAREIHSAGIDRSSVKKIVQTVEADSEHRDWITIFYDRRNAGETPDEWMQQIGQAIDHLTTKQVLILPQVPVSGGREDGLTLPVLLEINERIRAQYPENTFDVETEAEFLKRLDDDATRADHIHRNDTGAQIEAAFIDEWLTAKGW